MMLTGLPISVSSHMPENTYALTEERMFVSTDLMEKLRETDDVESVLANATGHKVSLPNWEPTFLSPEL